MTATHRTLVTGATGSIGGTLVDLLAESTHPFVVLCRRPEQAAAFRSRGVDVVQGDFDDTDSIRAAQASSAQVVEHA